MWEGGKRREGGGKWAGTHPKCCDQDMDRVGFGHVNVVVGHARHGRRALIVGLCGAGGGPSGCWHRRGGDARRAGILADDDGDAGGRCAQWRGRREGEGDVGQRETRTVESFCTHLNASVTQSRRASRDASPPSSALDSSSYSACPLPFHPVSSIEF